MKKLKALLIIS